jgi:hypothetical protein
VESEHLLHLLILNQWILLGNFLLLLCEVVKRTIVVFGKTMLRTEHISTPALDLKDANLLVTAPALVCVCL